MIPIEEDLAVLISMIHRHGSTYIQRVLEDLDIGSGQHAYLLALADRPGASQEELARLFGVDKAGTARAVKRLEDKGYLRREPSPSDARAYRLHLTPSGQSSLGRVREALADWNGILLEAIPPRERAAVRALIAALARTAAERVRSGGG